jgi:hypothetical protein
MNLDLAENTNKLILLVVAGVALLLTLNTYQKQVGKNLAVVLSIVTIVVVGYVAFTLMNKPPVSNNANNVNLVNSNNNLNLNNLVNNRANANRVNNNANVNRANANLVNANVNRANNNVNGANNNVNRANNNVNRANNNVNRANNNVNRANNNVNRANNVVNNAEVVEGFKSRGTVENFEGHNAGEEENNVSENSNHPADNGVLKCSDLLPADTNSTWAQVSPSGVGELCTKNLLNSGHHIGVNTQGCSLRNANRGIRSEPPNPQVQVSPWLQTTICPDLLRRPLE